MNYNEMKYSYLHLTSNIFRDYNGGPFLNSGANSHINDVSNIFLFFQLLSYFSYNLVEEVDKSRVKTITLSELSKTF